MQEENDSSVERLKKSLYIRNKVPRQKRRYELEEDQDEPENLAHSWVDENERKRQEEVLNNPDKMLEELHKGHLFDGSEDDFENFRKEEYQSRMNKREVEKEQKITSRVIRAIFIASFVFFLFAIGLAAYFLVGGKNQVSCDNVKITISGPQSVASGKKLSLDVMVKNNNPVSMKDATIEMVYPEGSRNAENSSMNITSEKNPVGTITTGEQVRTTARALLFGKEQTESEIKAIVTYTIDDSDALFTCEAPYRILIATAPVSLTVKGLEEISTGQELEIELGVTSNSDEVVPNLRVVADYPYGFDFISAEPKPTVDTSVWDLGDLPPGIERVIRLRGTVKGQTTEARAISFSVGGVDNTNEKGISVVMQKIDHVLLITRPFLELNCDIDGDGKSQTTATLGKEVTAKLHWKNTLDSALHNVEVVASFDGIMLDPYTVVVSNGFFRSVDSTIIWSSQTQNDLKLVEPGEEGDLTFVFNTKHFELGTNVSEPSMNIEFSVKARRNEDESSVSQNLLGQAKKTILFDTEVVFDTYALHGIGPFTNTGPHPPVVDKETTYTIALTIANNINDMESIEVRGELPVNVTWLGNVSSNSERVVFNPVTREVVWAVGDVKKGTGYLTEARTAYFQISTTPSVSQVRSELTLFNDVTMQGIDVFTKNVLKRNVLRVKSDLDNDPYFKDEWGAVQVN